MIIWGENALVASPKEQVMKIMNLSGKRTHIGRNSGERFRILREATKEESHFW